MNRLKLNQYSRGFTLLEVVVAVAIVAVALVVMVEAVNNLTINGQRLKQQQYASWAAQNVLAQQLLKTEQLPPQPSEGSTNMGNMQFGYKSRLSETDAKGFYRYDIDIYPAQTPQNTIYTLSSYFSNAMEACSKHNSAQGVCIE